MKIRPVILSGGSGTRLWPASRRSLPKQFITFPAIGSLFTHTLARVAGLEDMERPLVVSSRQHGFLCRREAKQAGIDAEYILEEGGRNTAPAIYFAALASNPDDILLIMPSDHWIDDIAAFSAMVTRAVVSCTDGRWVTFGVTPDMPATGYGYIEVRDRNEDVMDVASFTEKPDPATAQSYLEQGRFFWNSGIFMVTAGTCLDSFRTLQPDLCAHANNAWHARIVQNDETILPRQHLQAIPSISVDYAIMERQTNIALLPFAGTWSDVGSWDSLSSLIEKQLPEPNDPDHTMMVDTRNAFIHSSGRTIATVGVEDIIIVDDDDATLIVGKGHTEKVKAVIDQLAEIGNSAGTEHSFEYRPWGMFENLLDSDVCKVKRLTVDPGQHLSLQYHHKRSEHWVVVSGTASVQLGDETMMLEPGHSIDIPLGMQHALGNDTTEPVIVIEVQMGSYFGEDDIVRVSDPYNR
ncbi:MAG: mannose-1-phosphate guanylyltransferase/mannose-6-phosphate isomerase [Candidatus Puniceispirillaceae bacterium]